MTVPVQIEVGDRVIANYINPAGVTAVNFVVTAIDGTRVDGAPSAFRGPLDSIDGWSFQLVEKADQHLPATLSSIAAVFNHDPDAVVHLIGEGTDWQLDGGARLDDLSGLVGWQLWEDYMMNQSAE